MKKYNPNKIEKKWQKYWETKNLYRAKENSGKPKYYQLETFPYPSAAGLHVGHPKGYIAEDIHARYMRMNGKEVLYTMGWDAFGLPTENYAIKVDKSPQEVARANVKNFKRQVQMFGLSYDWDREINTSEPEYYKWTQWLFLRLYKAGIAYRAKARVNWCPKDQTVLANEQVVDGKCERDGEPVIQKEVEQWFFKITDYADRLLKDIEGLDWPEETIKRQKDWIGKSEGAVIKFLISNSKFLIPVFTTRPDTLFGVTYLVLAPEHKLLENNELGITNYEEVKEYIEKAKRKTELQRKEEAGDKTGVELKGIKAVNPANNEEISIWVADYVLGGYGTGAIMAVPVHDERDAEFAKKFGLPFSDAPLVDKEEIIKKVQGERKTQYKLRDWSVSRQRYWGVPIPIIYCHKCWETLNSKSETLNKSKTQNSKFQTTKIDGIEYAVIPVPEENLPVKLPNLKDYRPKGMPPLASAEKWLKVKCPKCGGQAQRDPETLDTFVDSSWYYLRYVDAKNDKKIFDADKAHYWLPVDLYVIGAEHVTAHLLYARFVTKFLFDQGHLEFAEPFLKLRHQGMILGPDGRRMSKRWGNVINPDDVIGEYGADAVRLYEMFMGPFEDGQPWDTKGLVGTYRFLNRVWNFINKLEEPKETNKEAERIINKYVKEIGDDIKNMKFNTGVSGLMKLLNELEDKWLTAKQYETFLKLLAPFAPHIAEELWSRLTSRQGGTSQSRILDLLSKSGQVPKNYKSIHLQSWPDYDETLLAEEMVTVAIQINGKLRDTIEVKKGLTEDDIKKLVLSREKVKNHLEGKDVRKFIYVQDRLTNIVV